MPIDFHAFTDADAVASGRVRKLSVRGRICRFEYSYVWLGVNVEGRFKGTLDASGQLEGKWEESSDDAIAGRDNWEGRAAFSVHEVGGRRTMLGVWGMKTGKMNERWVVQDA